MIATDQPKPLRVLFVNRMASMVRGGGETFDLEISRHLEKLGCAVTFLSGLPLIGAATSPIGRDRSYCIRTPYFGWFPWDKVRGGWRLRLADFWMFEKTAASWAAARQDEFDVVQVCELPTFVAEWKKRNAGPPVVMRLTAPDYVDDAGAIASADAVIASGTTILKLKNGVRPDCVDIPNAVDTELFQPGPSRFREEHGIGGDEFVILYVARFQVVKNHRMVIAAFRRFVEEWPRARLVLVGSGPLRADIEAECRAGELLDHVLFLGEMEFPALPAIYNSADMKVIASFYESFCFAALEAMACGLPLAVTDTDWVPHLIELGKGGRVVTKDRPEELCRVMLEFAADPELRKQMGAFNRRKAVDQFRWEASARKLMQLYGSLAVGSGRTS